jgi:hypothetical protein
MLKLQKVAADALNACLVGYKVGCPSGGGTEKYMSIR